ncbi:MAG: hypothetical protein IJP32_12630 [Clostridia bacterium]|nr:hypothetical protein [Clostridia bacterium]MBQ9997211.1 hypothetical protein [Clostridia bacterium]
MKVLIWFSIFGALLSYNAGIGENAVREEPVIPELPPVMEEESAETEENPETEEAPAPTAAQLYTEFFRTHYESVDPKTDWDNAAYWIALPDLDFNGIPELIVEKAGASASGLLEIYTIEEGEVRTFGYSRLDLPRARNAVDFAFEGSLSDINIHEDGDGFSIFLASHNGAMDFERYAYYRFTSSDGALACETVSAYVAEMTDWEDYRFDTAVWNGAEYTYDEFEPLYREWLADYFQAHPISDAAYMENLRTYEIGNTEEMLALIAEICG